MPRRGTEISGSAAAAALPLLKAAEAGDALEVKRLVKEEGLDVGACDLDKVTALHVAAFFGHSAVLRTLKELGAGHWRPDRKTRNDDDDDDDPLRPLSMAELDFISGPEKTFDADEASALHVAAGAGQVDAVRTLARLGADLDAHDVHGFSPLYVAAGEGHCEVLRVLVEEGADVGFCVIDMMHKATYFLPDDQSPAGGRIPDGARNVPRVWPRRQPAQGSYLQRTRALLHLGLNSSLHVDGSSACHVAAYYGRSAALRTLVMLGADVNAEDADGDRALHWAAGYSRVECVDTVRTLVELGADVDAFVADGVGTALHAAALTGRSATVRVLVQLGATLGVQAKTRAETTRRGERPGVTKSGTALHFAALTGQADCTAALLELGEDVNARDHERRTPLDLCKAQIQSGVTSAYLNSCFDCGDSVPFACEWQAVKRLLEGVVSSAQRKAEEIGAALVAEEEAEERRKSAPGKKSKKSKKKKAKGGDEGGAAAAAAAEEEEEPQSQAASHRPVEVCAGCGCGGGGGSMKKCGTCRSVRYCGSECQHKHWAVHKVHCKGKGQA